MRENACAHRDTRLFQKLYPTAGVPRVYVYRTDDNAPDAGLHDRRGARRRSAFGGARLERHVQRRVLRNYAAGVSDALDLRVGEPGSTVVPARDDLVSHH